MSWKYSPMFPFFQSPGGEISRRGRVLSEFGDLTRSDGKALLVYFFT
jgi:hypothetical protein